MNSEEEDLRIGERDREWEDMLVKRRTGLPDSLTVKPVRLGGREVLNDEKKRKKTAKARVEKIIESGIIVAAKKRKENLSIR